MHFFRHHILADLFAANAGSQPVMVVVVVALPFFNALRGWLQFIYFLYLPFLPRIFANKEKFFPSSILFSKAWFSSV